MKYIQVTVRWICLQVLNPTITIERDGEATVKIRPTIPFASETIELNSKQLEPTPLYIQLSLPENSSCNVFAKSCSTNISSYRHNERQMYENPNNWKKIHTIKIFNSEGLRFYIGNHTISLRFTTGKCRGNGSQIFDDSALQNVQARNLFW